MIDCDHKNMTKPDHTGSRCVDCGTPGYRIAEMQAKDKAAVQKIVAAAQHPKKREQL